MQDWGRMFDEHFGQLVVSRRGDELTIHCPFPERHRKDDTNPSAHVNIANRIWYCHVCKPKGEEATLSGLFREKGIGTQEPTLRRQTVDTPMTIPEAVNRWNGDLMRHPLLGQILEERKISVDLVRKTKIGIRPMSRQEGRFELVVPMLEDNGDVKSCHIRQLTEGDTLFGKTPRKYYWWPKGPAGLWSEMLLQEWRTQKKITHIWVCAGELDAAALASCDIPAVAGTGGEGFWRSEWSKKLKGLHAVICMDTDTTGQSAARKVARMLVNHCPSIRIVELPKEYKDATEFLQENDVSELRELGLAAPIFDPEHTDAALGMFAEGYSYYRMQKGNLRTISNFVLVDPCVLRPLRQTEEDFVEAVLIQEGGQHWQVVFPRSAFNSQSVPPGTKASRPGVARIRPRDTGTTGPGHGWRSTS